MLSYSTVEPRTLELLKKLMSEPLLSQSRLVGGTSLALQIGHRKSIDLDFFGSITDSAEEIKQTLRNNGQLTVIKESANIKSYTVDGVKVDFVNYCYDWIDNLIYEDGLRLASMKDIAAMKINAVEGRGSKKDFIDLYFLLQHFSLQHLLDFYAQKYPENSTFRALMSLTYFDDADSQISPEMCIPAGWEHIKKSISRAVQEYQ